MPGQTQDSAKGSPSVSVLGEMQARAQGQAVAPATGLDPAIAKRYQEMKSLLAGIELAPLKEVTGSPHISYYADDIIRQRSMVASLVNSSKDTELTERLKLLATSLESGADRAGAIKVKQCIEIFDQLKLLGEKQLATEEAAKTVRPLRERLGVLLKSIAVEHGYHIDFHSHVGGSTIVPVDAVVSVPIGKSSYQAVVVGAAGRRDRSLAGEAVAEEYAVLFPTALMGSNNISSVLANELGHLFLSNQLGVSTWSDFKAENFSLPQVPKGVPEVAKKLFSSDALKPRSVTEVHELFSDSWSTRAVPCYWARGLTRDAGSPWGPLL